MCYRWTGELRDRLADRDGQNQTDRQTDRDREQQTQSRQTNRNYWVIVKSCQPHLMTSGRQTETEKQGMNRVFEASGLRHSVFFLRVRGSERELQFENERDREEGVRENYNSKTRETETDLQRLKRRE